jgi:hypothetical protein
MADDAGSQAFDHRGLFGASRGRRPAGVHRVMAGGSDAKARDANLAAIDWRLLLAGSRWRQGGEGLAADVASYLHAAGMRAKVRNEARGWSEAWRSFVAASGGKLGVDHVDPDAALRARFRSLYVRTALIRVQERRDGYLLSIGSAVVLYGCLTVLAGLVSTGFGAAVVVEVTALSVLYVLHAMLRLLSRTGGGRWSLALMYSLTAGGSIGAAMWLARHSLGYARPNASLPAVSDYRSAFDAGVAIGGAGLSLSMALSLLASMLGPTIVGRVRMRNDPDAIVFGAFVEILAYLGSGPTRLTSLRARRTTAQCLERAALAVEYGLCHTLRLADSRNDSALRNKLRAVASMIRSHQVPFVLSERVAFQELSSLSVRAIRSICLGVLGSLPTPAAPVAPNRGGLTSSLAVVRHAAVALAPAGIALVLLWQRVLTADAIGCAVVVAAVAWAVMTELMALDPLLANRLSGQKDTYPVRP